MATTIKVSASTRDRVNDVGARLGRTADQVVSGALIEYERALFWEQYTAAADASVADPEMAAVEDGERELWDAATARDAMTDG